VPSRRRTDAPTSRRTRLLARADDHNVPLRTILTTVFVVVVVYFLGLVLYRLRDILLLMLVGGFIALVLNPLVNYLQKWKLPRRGAAVFVVMAFSMMAFIGLAAAFGYPLVNSITHLANALPQIVQRAEHNKGWIGHLLHKYHIAKWLTKNSSKLVTLAKGLSKPALALGKGAATVLLLMVTLFAFVILLLLESPKIRVALLGMMSPEKSAWVSRVGAKISKVALGYMLANLTTSIIAGTVIFVTLFCLSVPFAILWALWVALVDFLPQIGGALAGIPTVLFALIHSTTAGVVTLIVFAVYTQIENHVLNPIIMSRTEKINPLTVFIAILVGAEIGAWIDGIFGGFVAVLLAVPAAASMHVLLREFWYSTQHPTDTITTTSPGDAEPPVDV
jgi:predicted PurR-regulated permease PerM